MDKKRNIRCEISYDGSDFHGFQIQPDKRTVQGEIESALEVITKQKISIIASGRTDAGVHARKQVCNFFTESRIPEEKWKSALKVFLPEDIIVLNTREESPTFHSRFDVKTKTYRYHIYTHPTLDVFRRKYVWHYPYLLNMQMMKEAAAYLIGEHDFTAFSSAKSDVENKVRTIYNAELWQNENEILFEISGNGFLYNMVRIIVGTLVKIGQGKMGKEEIWTLFENKSRSLAGKTAPAHGLILWDVSYETTHPRV